MKVEGCVALVSGGASGLGEATVRFLLAAGAQVAILDLAQERGQSLVAELGSKTLFCKADVTDEKDVEDAVNRTIESFGAIHVAVNCAGVVTPGKVLGKEGPMRMSEFNQVVQINLMGTMNVIRLVVPQMLKNVPNADAERGVVICTASLAAFEGQYGQVAYAASKAGVVGMTLPMSREFGQHGIRVMTIAPGIFETPMVAGMPNKVKEGLIKMMVFPKRAGRPREFATLVVHIIENLMLNGSFIRLDGGVRMGAR